MLKISQYPRNADGTPMDLEVGVLTNTTGNGGLRLANVPVGPDNAPIDAKAVVIVDPYGNSITDDNVVLLSPKWYGAKGDGTTDDADALNAALAAGKTIWLHPDTTYAYGKPLIFTSGSKFVGKGRLLMLTGTGKFDHADYTGDPLTYSGIVAEGLSDIRIEARIQMQANAGIRCCNAIWVRNCTDVHIDVEAFGFKETRYGVVEFNSNKGNLLVRAYIHDCTTNSTTLPSMQITGVSVDSNRYDPGTGPVMSEPCDFAVRVKNVTLGAAARTFYGPQTDGLNLQGSGYAGHTGWVSADTVDEPLDCWSDGNNIRVIAKNCFWGVKLIYGASYNEITATVATYEKAGVVYAGAVTGQKATAYNQVRGTATGGGQIGSEGDVAGVRFEDPTGVFEANSNITEITVHGDGVNLDRIVHIKSGSNNTVKYKGDGYAVEAALDASTGTGNVMTAE